eukprot:1866429-Karenia_brevis.AAC.1
MLLVNTTETGCSCFSPSKDVDNSDNCSAGVDVVARSDEHVDMLKNDSTESGRSCFRPSGDVNMD